MKLVIVESPAKSKTIGNYLGEGYVVEASVGHIRDLATSGKGGLGIDVDNDFKATYVISKDKKKVVNNLINLSKSCEEVIIATDPDREGEAIAWHLANVLNLDINTAKRLEFHEITKESIVEAINNPRTIDMNLVNSQEARRIIDRIIGFKLSKLLQSKIKSKSAGRVQSVTLKFIVDREKEINNFNPSEYWTISAFINNDLYKIDLNKYLNKKIEIKNENEAVSILNSLSGEVKLNDIKKTIKNISSKEPFITSTLQQEANSKFNFKTKLTASICQKLYEGIEIGEGLTGLITYIRTDSTRLSDVFVNKAKKYIFDNYGDEYFKGIKVKKAKGKIQDAHEAIRPTSLSRTPESIKPYLTNEEFKIYKLIYDRTLASLMVDKKIETTTLSFIDGDYEFNLSGSKTIYEGYNILKIDKSEDKYFDELILGSVYKIDSYHKDQHFTEPPARFNEGKVVKLMEEKGIGRPSTYSSTIQTLISRKYVTSNKNGLTPTEQGIKTVTVLRKYFSDLMDETYTANMELNLDSISEGNQKEIEVINDFYNPFIEHFDKIKDEIYKDPLEETGEKCPQCGSPLVIRHGKNGDFVACSNYPKCRFIKKEEKEPLKLTGEKCPNCGHDLVYRKGKNNKTFIGCSNYPQCHYVKNDGDETDKELRYCPDCGALLVKRKSKKGYFYGCSNYPKCKHIENL